MKVELVKLIGKNCESIDDGRKLHQVIHPEIVQGASVELDFAGVESIITPFLNASLGKLLDLFEKETLMQRLVLCHISEEHLKRVNEYIDRKDQQNLEATTRDLMVDLFEEDELSDSGM